MSAQPVIAWDDLPPFPWPEDVEPTGEQMVAWVRSLSDEHLAWWLQETRALRRVDAECFALNHARTIERLQREVAALREQVERPV